MKSRILIVEDDIAFGNMLQKWFERNNFFVKWCTGMLSAQQAITESDFNLILSDLRLPDGDGIMFLAWLKEKHISSPVIIMTGYGEIQTAVAAIKLGAFDYLEKPINPSILSQKIDVALARKTETIVPEIKTQEVVEKSADFIEGRSLFSTQMYSYINKIAPTQMSVMIVGESGTGKEHVARMIHERSARANAPFVAVDCGGLSMELAPSELFGHKKGSFTSAIEDKTGVFVEANGGTLFLDEVGNLPYGVQKQILRALQERQVRQVGTSKNIDVDVRIVTATNENLEKAILEGTFREDLYHRLNEFMIRVPSLRERQEDIALFTDFFISEANKELGREVKHVSDEAREILKNYSWPGNLRELRNVVRRAVLFSVNDVITYDSLPVLRESKELLEKNFDVSLAVSPEQEKEKIILALEKTHGNKSKAAVLLNVDRKTLYNKIHRYGL